MKENIQTTRLENGLTILTDKMSDVRSAALGIFFRSGSRDEPAELNGISHFIEHAVFKGTARRSALDIAREIDRLGGNFDAFTTHESVGFALKVVDEQLPQAFDLLADMVSNPRFDEQELKRERKVIVEEMKMVEDAPEEFLSEIFTAEFFQNTSLSLPIEGTRKSVRTFKREVVNEYHTRIFQPENLIVAAAGNVEHNFIVEAANKFFDFEKPSSKKPKIENQKPKSAAPIILKKKRGLEQAHLIIAAPWIEERSERRYAAHLFESIFGSGTSSRLWQTIRERHGLAYSVGAGGASFRDCGVFSIFAATSPENAGDVIDLAIRELQRIKESGVSDEELRLAKDQAKAAILLGLEDSGARAGALVQQEITFGKTVPLAETLRRIEQVEAEEIQELAREFFQTERIALAALGNLGNLKVERERLNVN